MSPNCPKCGRLMQLRGWKWSSDMPWHCKCGFWYRENEDGEVTSSSEPWDGRSEIMQDKEDVPMV